MKSIAAAALILLLVAGGSCSASAQVKDREDVLAELAAIELRVSVDRDFAGAEAALAELETRFESEGHADALKEPGVEALRLRIRAKIAEARRDDGGDIALTVADAINASDEITLTTLGTRAAAAILASFDPDGAVTPLTNVNIQQRLSWLFRLDEPAGWGFVKDDPLRLGVEDLGEVLGAVRWPGMQWTKYPNRKPTLDRPEWISWFTRVLALPAASQAIGQRGSGAAANLTQVVQTLAAYDAFTPDFAEGLAGHVQRVNGYVALDVIRAVEQGRNGERWSPSVQPFLERLVADPRDAVRIEVCKALVVADASPGLRSRVEDPSPEVRTAVVDSLGPRQRVRVRWGGRDESPGSENEDLPEATDVAGRALLVRLSADAQPSVREEVVSVLGKLVEPLSPDVYRRLAADPDDQVRTAMVRVNVKDTNLQTELHRILARDVEPRVVIELDRRLANLDWTKETERAWALPVFEERLGNTAVPLDRNLVSSVVGRSPEARQHMTQVWLERGDDRLLSALMATFVDSRNRRVSNTSLVEDWLCLPGPDLARLLPVVQRLQPELVPVLPAQSRYQNVKVSSDIPAAVEPLARDATLPLDFRLAVATLVARDPDPDRLALLRDLLIESVAQGGPKPDWNQITQWGVFVENLPRPALNAFLCDLMTSASLPDDVAKQLLRSYASEAPDAEPVMRIILDRWPEDTELVPPIVSRLDLHPALASEALLARTLHGTAGLPWAAVAGMARLRDPRYLGLLKEALDPTWVRDDDETGLAEKAVSAIHGYMSDEAAQILLDAAANSPRSTVRENALAAVEAIGRYRDALAAWQRRTTDSATREAAIGQLAAVVADRDKDAGVRAEAVRALGTLQAVDLMPLIIQSLLDDDSRVRDAARAALERLNAPPPEANKPQGATEEPQKP